MSTAPAAHSEYEFGGPLGAVAIILFLPLVVYMLYFGCTKTDCVTKWSDAYELPLKLYAGLTGPKSPSLWSWKAFLAVIAWIKLHFLLYLVLPGATVPGVKLADGSHLNYYINAHLAFWLCVAVFVVLPAAGLYFKEPSTITLSLVYDHYLELTSAAIAYSFAMAAYCYAASFRRGELLAAGGQTGNAVYDFFIGRALNPRIGMLDLKVACELRPGLIGWMLLNLGMAFKQYERDGTVSGSMIAVNLGQAYYVWDALSNEQAILTTMDVTTDGFGFMLAFGDLAWVPFTYSLQVRARRRHRPPLARSCSPAAARPPPSAATRRRLLVHATLTTIINETLTPRSPLALLPGAHPGRPRSSAALVGSRPRPRSQRPRALHLPRRQLREGCLSARPERTRGGAPAVPSDQARHALAHFRLVGHGAQDQLHGRLAHGPLMVPDLRRRLARRLFLRHLFRSAPDPPRGAR